MARGNGEVIGRGGACKRGRRRRIFGGDQSGEHKPTRPRVFAFQGGWRAASRGETEPALACLPGRYSLGPPAAASTLFSNTARSRPGWFIPHSVFPSSTLSPPPIRYLRRLFPFVLLSVCVYIHLIMFSACLPNFFFFARRAASWYRRLTRTWPTSPSVSPSCWRKLIRGSCR